MFVIDLCCYVYYVCFCVWACLCCGRALEIADVVCEGGYDVM